jgi:hypothetical protein
VLAAATALAGNGTPINTGSANELTIAVYGDSPYGTSPTDTSEFDASPAFIDSINADPKVSLVLHVGDIHSGSQYCTAAYDSAIFDLWQSFKDPLIYTPGDNEWTDCNKSKEGGDSVDGDGNPVNYASGNPVANLELIRSIFFAEPGVSLGGRKKQVLTQATSGDPAHPSDAKYVENVIWEQSKVLFVAINLPGGSNNDQDVWYAKPAPETAEQTAERTERTGADLRWLDEAFEIAARTGAQGVVIQAQADMWDPEKGKDHQSGYEPIVANIAAHTLAFGKPVLMLNGDSHVYLSDNPLAAADPLNYMHPGYDVPNFHRIVVHGSTFPLEWLKLVVAPGAHAPNGANAFGPFKWSEVVPNP